MSLHKVSIIGAGGTGSDVAQALALRGVEELVLVDVDRDMAVGKALDLWQQGALSGRDAKVSGGDEMSRTKGSEVIVITAGNGRVPGISREELLAVNAKIVGTIVRSAAVLSPNAHIVVLTNPADLLARVAWEASGFPAERVTGQGGILDSARMATFVADKVKVSVQDIRAMVLGGHGDSMIPVRDLVSVHGVPVRHLLTDEQWRDIVERTRFGGGEILSRFKTHGATRTPGWAVAKMVMALGSEVPSLLPISTRSNGAYGIARDTYVGLPALLSRRGVERVVEVPMNDDDRQQLLASAEHLEQTWQVWKSKG